MTEALVERQTIATASQSDICGTSECNALTAASRFSPGTNRLTECGDTTQRSGTIPRFLRTCIALNGRSDETPPKQVRLTELDASRCRRRSLLPSRVRNSASSHSESQATVMLVFPAAKSEARSCGQDRLFCARCCANFSKPWLRSLESISTCSMRSIELTARTLPLSMCVASFITSVECSAPPHCFRTRG